MSALTCDVCGGSLSVDAGGKSATCDFCGAKHSMERIREKVQEIKGTVSISGTIQARQTGTEEDVQQWKQLLFKYMDTYDYSSAISIAKKILEASPADAEANNAYISLRNLQYFDIRNGVLVEYNGGMKQITVPQGVIKIVEFAFESDVEKLILPETYVKIDTCICKGEINELVLPKTLTEINSCICEGSIGKLILPKTQIRVNSNICNRIGKIVLSEPLSEITLPICEYLDDEIVFHKKVTIRGIVQCKKAVVKDNPDYFIPFIRCIHLEVPSDYNGDIALLDKNYSLECLESSDAYKKKAIDHIAMRKTTGNSYADLFNSPFAKLIKERCEQGVCWYCGCSRFINRWFVIKCSNCGKEQIF